MKMEQYTTIKGLSGSTAAKICKRNSSYYVKS